MTYSVLVADDDDDIRLLLRVILGHECDFEVVAEAATPDECVQMAQQHHPAVIVIDHEFRGYATGADTAPTLRAICPNALIIMFSAYDSLRNELSNKTGIDGFVLKTDVSRLPNTLRDMLRTNA
jgi:DNA-binding NarL/FixJ family response regulator